VLSHRLSDMLYNKKIFRTHKKTAISSGPDYYA